jgi:integrase
VQEGHFGYTTGPKLRVGTNGKFEVPVSKVRFKTAVAEDEIDLEFGFLRLPQALPQAAPDAEWRLLIAPSRCGGMRCPSEHLSLRWQDVDWERTRFRVDSPKTGQRWVPIFPELRP